MDGGQIIESPLHYAGQYRADDDLKRALFLPIVSSGASDPPSRKHYLPWMGPGWGPDREILQRLNGPVAAVDRTLIECVA
jgi:hypothetical protein